MCCSVILRRHLLQQESPQRSTLGYWPVPKALYFSLQKPHRTSIRLFINCDYIMANVLANDANMGNYGLYADEYC